MDIAKHAGETCQEKANEFEKDNVAIHGQEQVEQNTNATISKDRQNGIPENMSDVSQPTIIENIGCTSEEREGIEIS